MTQIGPCATPKYNMHRRSLRNSTILNIQWNIQNKNSRLPPPQCRTFQTSALSRGYQPPEIAGDPQFPPTNRSTFPPRHTVTHGKFQERNTRGHLQPNARHRQRLRRKSYKFTRISWLHGRVPCQQATFRLHPKCFFGLFLTYEIFDCPTKTGNFPLKKVASWLRH
jgi:hypothetical protein